MALSDNPRFLLSHIRHSFITSDDTGMCEMVMLNETVPKTHFQNSAEEDGGLLDYWDKSTDSDLLETGVSCDIISDMQLMGAHRRRSNTAQRLERMKKERKNQAKIKTVQWRENPHHLSEPQLAELFPKKIVEPKIKESVLSEQLKQFPTAPNNPFNEYARFDGKMTETGQKKKMFIYLTMVNEVDRSYPMEVITVNHARVQDLVGLICWQYTKDGLEPKLKPNAASYCLRIAEETGEVDEDFPSLESKEPVAKFDFPYLALVEKDVEDDAITVVTVHIDDVFSKIQVTNQNISLKEILEQTLRRRKGILKSKGLDYRLEKYSEPSSFVDLNTTLAEAGTSEFNLIWDVSSESEEGEDEWDKQAWTAMEAPLYQSYSVCLITKLGRKPDVQLGISSEKLEVTPMPNKSVAKFLSKQAKATTYYMKDIAACEIVKRKYGTGKAVFKLVHHNGTEYKSHLFESDLRTSQEIVKKLQYILEMTSSNSRKEYLAIKERKLQRKKNLIR